MRSDKFRDRDQLVRPPRPLRAVPLADALPLRPGRLTITMSVGQWDAVLAAAYDLGATLLELDGDERPVRAYRKADTP